MWQSVDIVMGAIIKVHRTAQLSVSTGSRSYIPLLILQVNHCLEVGIPYDVVDFVVKVGSECNPFPESEVRRMLAAHANG